MNNIENETEKNKDENEGKEEATALETTNSDDSNNEEDDDFVVDDDEKMKSSSQQRSARFSLSSAKSPSIASLQTSGIVKKQQELNSKSGRRASLKKRESVAALRGSGIVKKQLSSSKLTNKSSEDLKEEDDTLQELRGSGKVKKTINSAGNNDEEDDTRRGAFKRQESLSKLRGGGHIQNALAGLQEGGDDDEEERKHDDTLQELRGSGKVKKIGQEGLRGSGLLSMKQQKSHMSLQGSGHVQNKVTDQNDEDAAAAAERAALIKQQQQQQNLALAKRRKRRSRRSKRLNKSSKDSSSLASIDEGEYDFSDDYDDEDEYDDDTESSSSNSKVNDNDETNAAANEGGITSSFGQQADNEQFNDEEDEEDNEDNDDAAISRAATLTTTTTRWDLADRKYQEQLKDMRRKSYSAKKYNAENDIAIVYDEEVAFINEGNTYTMDEVKTQGDGIFLTSSDRKLSSRSLSSTLTSSFRRQSRRLVSPMASPRKKKDERGCLTAAVIVFGIVFILAGGIFLINDHINTHHRNHNNDNDGDNNKSPTTTTAIQLSNEKGVANPENHGNCPVKEPNPDLGPISCDLTILTSDIDCEYNAYACPGYDDYVTYTSYCTCFDEGEGNNQGVLICAQTSVVCPGSTSTSSFEDQINSSSVDYKNDDSNEGTTPPPTSSNLLTSCPRTKPNDFTPCSFYSRCRYTPRSCPDNTDIVFEHLCSCTSSGVVQCISNNDVPKCHNTLSCPIHSPAGRNEDCMSTDDDSDGLTCNYNPAGCPNTASKGVFLTQCNCNNGEFECIQNPPLHCDIQEETTILIEDSSSSEDADTPDIDVYDLVDYTDDNDGDAGSPNNSISCPKFEPLMAGDFACDAGEMLYEDCYYSPVICNDNEEEPFGYNHLCKCESSALNEEESYFHCTELQIMCSDNNASSAAIFDNF